ncbi:hypothetical protein HYR82_00020, partial [Candidatus Peregrinibacteria bacterium]|nr:hypothetical protein [Candidatus Peregrinibacteria bacterium]
MGIDPDAVRFSGIIAHNTYISGNTGIGKLSPTAAKLEVVGTISGSALTLLNPGGINNMIGNTVLGGTLSSVSKGRLTVYGSGAFTGSMSGNTLLIQSGAYVRWRAAIGKTVPLAPLDVLGAMSGTSLVVSGNSTTINGHAYTWSAVQGTNGQVLTNNGSDGLSWTTVAGGSTAAAQGLTLANSALSLSASFSGSQLVLGNSKVGKGPLTVYGSGAFTGSMSGNTLLVQSGGYVRGRLAIGKTGALTALDVSGTISGALLTIN